MEIPEPASTRKRTTRRAKGQPGLEDGAAPSATGTQARSRRTSPSRSVRGTAAEEGEDQAEGPAKVHDRNAQPAPSVSGRLRDAAANVADQVQDTLTSVRQQPLSTTLWQLGSPLAIALVVLLISQAAARLLGASPGSPSASSSLAPEQYNAVAQENRELWQQLNETRTLLEQGDFRLREALARMQHLEGTFKHADAQSQQMQGDVNSLSNLVLEAVQNMQHEKTSISQVTANIEEATERIAAAAQPKLQAMVQHELSRFAADRTGMPDFALHSAGSRIIGHSALVPGTLQGLRSISYRLHGLFPGFSAPMHPDANKLLLSPGNSPGECLPLNGSSGHVDIRLRQKIVPHAVTIEHLPRSLAFDISSAPKAILVYAFADAPYLTEHFEERLPRALLLGRFQYDVKGDPVQTFQIESSQAFDHIRFKVSSNHGHPDYTCLYRLRVHGYKPDK
ncbi:hypothetical protein WJX74_008151 [Apatococcus lobatus]|uniref:SUN domain-containing protein n=2 Tax=Apatococcus TaxID=904362 RepID=A0AAW1TBX4_9CHLO